MRHEYSIFLGPVALYYAAKGFSRAFSGKHRPEWIALAVLFVFCAWIGIGAPWHEVSLFYPYTWFHAAWPGFQSVRVSTRLWFGSYLAVVAFSALGFKEPKKRLGLAIFVVIGLVPLLAGAGANLFKTSLEATRTQWNPSRAYPADIVAFNGPTEDQYRHLRVGESVINCTDNVEVYRPKSLQSGRMLGALLGSADTDSMAFDGSETFRSKWIGWNRFRVEARAAGPFVATLDMNHSPLWRLEGMGHIVSHLGERLTIASEDNVIDAELVFEQPFVAAGLAVSGVSLWALLCYAGYAFLRKKRRTATIRR
jgi:hypothetical protein